MFLVTKDLRTEFEPVDWQLPSGLVSLAAELFSIGGAAVWMKKAQPLALGGSLFRYTERRKIFGRPHQCFENCYVQRLANPSSLHYIGYGLFDNTTLNGQVWAFHCWLVQGTTLLETIEPMPTAYWGRGVQQADHHQKV
jgi:hypothetical protein